MPSKFLIFALIIFEGCSTAQRKSTFVQEIANLKLRSIKSFHVSSTEDAKKYFEKTEKFLKLIFEQSKNPFTAYPRWTDQCLAENIIGTIKEEEKHITMESSLLMNYFGSIGNCSNSSYAKKGVYLILYCKGSQEILEFKYPAVHALNLKEYVLCP
jgi:hypothetical protein